MHDRPAALNTQRYRHPVQATGGRDRVKTLGTDKSSFLFRRKDTLHSFSMSHNWSGPPLQAGLGQPQNQAAMVSVARAIVLTEHTSHSRSESRLEANVAYTKMLWGRGKSSFSK